MRIETSILHHLMHNESYARKVIPFLKPEYFQDISERLIFQKYEAFMMKYNSIPSTEAMAIEITQTHGLAQVDYDQSSKILSDLKAKPEAVTEEWLCNETERFCQDRSLHNAIFKSIEILKGTDKVLTKESLPDILKDALAVSFSTNVGHDWLEDWEHRYEFYHRTEEKIPFDLEYMNKITRGGFAKKSLNILLAGIHVGKSLCMCHMAAANLAMGKNVLYISMEMSEEKIGERIDANLLNCMLDEIEGLPHDAYETKMARVQSKTKGKLIIKEYPPATAHVGHIRHLLNELNLKKNFIPDIIYIDYLNICLSARYKLGSNVNSYTYIKGVAEELRGLAVERNLPVVSATQLTRPGFQSSDVGMQDTSESFGLPATADLMIAVQTSDELKELNQYLFKQLKNRYSDVNLNTKFVIGVDRARMRLYDVDQSTEQRDDVSVMDKSAFGQRDKEDSQMKWATKTKGRRDFSGLKVT